GSVDRWRNLVLETQQALEIKTLGWSPARPHLFGCHGHLLHLGRILATTCSTSGRHFASTDSHCVIATRTATAATTRACSCCAMRIGTSNQRAIHGTSGGPRYLKQFPQVRLPFRLVKCERQTENL